MINEKLQGYSILSANYQKFSDEENEEEFEAYVPENAEENRPSSLGESRRKVIKKSSSKVRTTLYLSKTDHLWLRMYCLKHGTTISNVMLQAINYLRANKDKQHGN